MKINVLTLFPDFFKTPLHSSMLSKAQEERIIEINVVDIRQFVTDKHQVTDLPPYGGGAGMVMKVEPIDRALESLKVEKGQKDSLIVLTSAKGKLFKQQTAQNFSQLKQLTVVCGHYEGVDERVAQYLVDAEIRVGNFVLTGGEPAALVMVDAVGRLVPGVLGNELSLEGESHSKKGEGAYPQYTRPENYRDWLVPPVLLSGNHQKIAEWRQEQRKKLE
ncbi:MAG: tRNA (guanosine(37)-N1)-methyltransferase TrmD [Patescibacteria group bacterium]|nr:tRNA (guanosine(37)-N1)-methyltransferase TrmD [Patescibacteria group bacterium]MEA2057051.1 tRNA (guanosine(37)-N1)-methyltransferase TrmD [Patescibacteria group bacterium]